MSPTPFEDAVLDLERQRHRESVAELKKQIADARAIAKRLLDLPPNGSKWTGAECDALAELCDVLGVEEAG